MMNSESDDLGFVFDRSDVAKKNLQRLGCALELAQLGVGFDRIESSCGAPDTVSELNRYRLDRRPPHSRPEAARSPPRRVTAQFTFRREDGMLFGPNRKRRRYEPCLV
jgi:hypothetical protein